MQRPEADRPQSRELGDELAESLRPSVEQSIRISARRDPHVLGEALAPLIGPGIRSAVVQAVAEMAENLNRVLEKAFSLHGLKWRWESIATGRPLGEIAWLRSLLYSVEQVLLIHCETGLLLRQSAGLSAIARDNELVAGALTAIQDFVKDAFKTERPAGVDTIKLGELMLWVEQGPQACLAALIVGNPPQALRVRLREALERIHRERGRDLLDFDGDSAPFAAASGILDDCLVSERRPPSARSRVPIYIALGTVMLLCLAAAGWSWRSSRRWNSYVENLREQPGIVVIDARRGWVRSSITGLRDPLASVPAGFSNISYDWKPFLSLQPEMVVARATRALSPPGGVRLRLEGDVLKVSGTSAGDWIATAERSPPAIAGIREIQFDVNPAQDLTRSKIEAEQLLFDAGSANIKPAYAVELDDVAKWMATAPGSAFRLDIDGHADESGNDLSNRTLSVRRAFAVRQALIQRSADASRMVASGDGVSDKGRCVTFHLRPTDSPKVARH